MLAIPAMKVDGAPDLSRIGVILRGQNCYSESQVNSDVERLEALRRAAVGVTEATEAGQENIRKYCTQLKAMSARFSSMAGDLKLSFGWQDAFTLKKITSSDVMFELACCMWNLGAFESLLGGRVDRNTEEGIRTANKHFQLAAGYFQHILEHIVPVLQSISTPCLSVDCLTLSKQLMLSQAQLCFYEKAVKDKKKDSMKSVVIAKLAAQASLFYQSSASSSRMGTLSTILDISWFAVPDFQSKCFKGAAEYWQALASKESALQRGSGYGEEIVRYNRAEVFVRQALDQGKKFNLPSTVVGSADSLLQAITSNRANAQHELNTIYLESLPADASLLEVQPVAMVKPAPIELTLSESEQLFRYVLPRHVIESNKNFYEEVMSYYQKTQVEAENATNIGRTSLSSMGLPGSLEVVKHDQPLPDTLWQKIVKARDMGGMDRLNSLLSDLKAASQRAWSSMTEIEDSLVREERTNADFQVRYPGFAGLIADPSTAIEIRRNNAQLRDAYRNAQTNDEKIEADMKSSETAEHLLLLRKTKDELHMLFRSAALEGPVSVNLLDLDESEVAANRMSPEASRLESKLHELAEIFEERTKQIEQMKALTTIDLMDYILHALSTNGDLYAKHIQYSNESKELMKRVTEGITRQAQLLDEIVRLNADFVRSKESDPAALARNKIIQTIEVAVAKFFALYSQLSSGVTFYSNLRAKLTTLQQNCDDLSYTQQWQRQEFEESQMQTQRSQQVAQRQEEQDRALAMSMAGIALNVPAANTAFASPSTAPAAAPITTTTASTASPYVSNLSALQYPGVSVQSTPSVFSPSAVGATSAGFAPQQAPPAAPATAAYGVNQGTPYGFSPTVTAASPSVSYAAYPGASAAATHPAFNPAVVPPAPAAPAGQYQYNASAYSVHAPAPAPPAAPTQSMVPPANTPAYASYNNTAAKSFDQKVRSLLLLYFLILTQCW